MRAIFDKMVPGQPFDPFAEEYNRMLDAVSSQQSGLVGQNSGLVAFDAENNTGGDLLRGQCAGIGGPIYTPTENEEAFFYRPSFSLEQAWLPNHYGKLAIAAHPIESGKIGKVWISDVVPALVNIGNIWHKFADAPDAAGNVLESKPHGTAQILWSESTTGSNVMCRVRLGPPRNCHVWGVPSAAVSPGNDMTLDVVVDSGPAGYSISDVKTARLHTKSPDIGTSDWCRIEWDVTDLLWHLVNAECP